MYIRSVVAAAMIATWGFMAAGCGGIESATAPLSPTVTSDPSTFTEDYLGQPRPGLTPAPFAPQIFSTAGEYGYNLHSSVYFLPDGEQVFFANQDPETGEIYPLTVRLMDEGWGTPEAVPAPPLEGPVNAQLSPHVHYLRLYYSAAETGGSDDDIYFIDWSGSGWSEPYLLSELNEDQGELYFSVERSDSYGSVDVYQARFVDGQYTDLENTGPPVNSSAEDYILTVAPDGHFLIIYRYDEIDQSACGLFVTFRRDDNTWSELVDLNTAFGIEEGFDASLSPDGRYLFVLDRQNGIYWVDVSALEPLRTE